MANKVLLSSGVIIVAGGLVALGYTAVTLSASSDEPSNPAAEAVADLPTVTNFTIRDETPGCTFDEETRSRTFDLVIPATPADYEAGYDECQFSTGRG
jgi:hypothetical protein